jgi:hypothetical protein
VNWGAVALGIGKGAIAADDSRAERTRELLIAEQRERTEKEQQRLRDSQIRKHEQDVLYDQQDRVVQQADRAKKDAAEAAENERRQKLTATRVRILRQVVPEFKDPAKYSDIDLQTIAASDDDFERYVPKRTAGTGTLPMGSPERLNAIRAEETVRGQVRSQFRVPPKGPTPKAIKSEEEYILENMDNLMKPQSGAYGRQTAGMTAEQARTELSRRYRAARGNAAAAAPTPPPRPTAGSAPPAAPGKRRKATQAEEDAALDASGGDVKKAAARLRAQGLY